MGILDHIFLIFGGITKLFFVVAVPFPPLVHKGSSFFIYLSTLVIFHLLDSSHPNECEMLSQYANLILQSKKLGGGMICSHAETDQFAKYLFTPCSVLQRASVFNDRFHWTDLHKLSQVLLADSYQIASPKSYHYYLLTNI